MKRWEKALLVACNNQKAVFQTRYLIFQVLREIALAMEMILVMEKANTMKSPVRTISQQTAVSISGCWFKTKIFLLNTQHQSDMPLYERRSRTDGEMEVERNISVKKKTPGSCVRKVIFFSPVWMSKESSLLSECFAKQKLFFVCLFLVFISLCLDQGAQNLVIIEMKCPLSQPC